MTKFSELGVDELLEIINDEEENPETREKAARFLRRQMDIPK